MAAPIQKKESHQQTTLVGIPENKRACGIRISDKQEKNTAPNSWGNDCRRRSNSRTKQMLCMKKLSTSKISCAFVLKSLGVLQK